jgi:hypothetical protein
LSFFLLFDAATLSKHARPPPDAPYDVVPVHMSFVDWVPAICSTRTYRSSLTLCPSPLTHQQSALPSFVSTTLKRIVGFLITALLDKTHLHSAFSGDAWGSEGSAAVRAKMVLFIGVALMAGGLAGSLVSVLLMH